MLLVCTFLTKKNLPRENGESINSIAQGHVDVGWLGHLLHPRDILFPQDESGLFLPLHPDKHHLHVPLAVESWRLGKHPIANLDPFALWSYRNHFEEVVGYPRLVEAFLPLLHHVRPDYRALLTLLVPLLLLQFKQYYIVK